MRPTREEAFALLQVHIKEEANIRHALAVEGVMRHFAAMNEEDADLWGTVGLLHDLDYEEYPEQHCIKVREILGPLGIDEQIIRAIQSHGYELCVDVQPESKMELTLYTIDELTGLIMATAYMRPSKSVMDLELKSLKKKFKDKRFAAGVDRSVITKGAVWLGMPLDDVLNQTILGMRTVADSIGVGMQEAEA